MKESISGMRQRHCNNQQLLAYLDGEIPGLAAKRVAEHLSCCWKCRAKMDDLERDVQQIARLFATPSAQDLWAAQQAKSRFQAWYAEVHFGGNPALKNEAHDFRRYWLTLAAGFCLLVLFFGLFRDHPARSADKKGILAKSLAFEQPIRHSEQIVQQQYSLAIWLDRPRVGHVRSELVVWAQPTKGRYASRWSNTTGQLQYAVWRPKQDGALWYRSLGSKVVREQPGSRQAPLRLADLAYSGASIEDIEGHLGEWLRRRQCEPVSLADEFDAFIENPHTNVSVEETGSGERVVSLIAERNTSRCKITMVLRADAKTGQPLSESFGFSTADSAYRIDFQPQNSQVLQPGPETAAVFQPRPTPREEAKILPKQTAEARSTTATIVSEADLLEAEIAALYVLHQNEICLGHPVSIWRNKGAGMVRIEGLIADATRRNELKAALGSLSRSKLLSVDLRLPDEAAHSQILRRTTELGTSGPQRTSMLINEYIDGLTMPGNEKQTLKSEAIKSADHYVSSGEALVQQVAALQSLATADLEAAPLSKEAAHLLSLMRQDHLRSLDQQLSTLTESVGGILQIPELRSSSINRNTENQSLTAASRNAMTQARRLQEALLDLFSTGQSKAVNSDESASALIESARALRSIVTRLQTGTISDTNRDGIADAQAPREAKQ
jgi:hypothetical protein